MVAVTGSTSDKNLSFKNVLGGLKLQLKGTVKIASITVTGNNNEILYGAATVTAQNGNTPTIALSDASAKTVKLNCGSGVQLNTTTATAFIIALPPMTIMPTMLMPRRLFLILMMMPPISTGAEIGACRQIRNGQNSATQTTAPGPGQSLMAYPVTRYRARRPVTLTIGYSFLPLNIVTVRA